LPQARDAFVQATVAIIIFAITLLGQRQDGIDATGPQTIGAARLNTGCTRPDALECRICPKTVPLLSRLTLALIGVALVDDSIAVIIDQVAHFDGRDDLACAVNRPTRHTFSGPRATPAHPRRAGRSVITGDHQSPPVTAFVEHTITVVIGLVTDLEVRPSPPFTGPKYAPHTDAYALCAATDIGSTLGTVVAGGRQAAPIGPFVYAAIAIFVFAIADLHGGHHGDACAHHIGPIICTLIGPLEGAATRSPLAGLSQRREGLVDLSVTVVINPVAELDVPHGRCVDLTNDVIVCTDIDPCAGALSLASTRGAHPIAFVHLAITVVVECITDFCGRHALSNAPLCAVEAASTTGATGTFAARIAHHAFNTERRIEGGGQASDPRVVTPGDT